MKPYGQRKKKTQLCGCEVGGHKTRTVKARERGYKSLAKELIEALEDVIEQEEKERFDTLVERIKLEREFNF